MKINGTDKYYNDYLFQDALDLARNGFESIALSQCEYARKATGADIVLPNHDPWLSLVDELENEAIDGFTRLKETMSDCWEPFLRLGEWEDARRKGAPDALIDRERFRYLFEAGRYDALIKELDMRPDLLEQNEFILLRQQACYHQAVRNYKKTQFYWKSPFWIAKLFLFKPREYYLRMYSDRLMHAFPGTSWIFRMHSRIHHTTIDVRRLFFGSLIPAAERYIEHRPEDALGYEHLARLCNARHRFRRAEAVCRNGLARAGESSNLCLLLGNALAGQDRLSEAADAYRKGIGIKDTVILQINLAATEWCLGNENNARVCLENVTDRDRNHPLAVALKLILDQPESSVEAYGNWLSGNPGVWLHDQSHKGLDRFVDIFVDRKDRLPGISALDQSVLYRIACPICGAPPDEMHHAYTNRMTRFRIDTCERCGYIFTNPPPPPDKLGLFYQSSFFNFDMERAEWYREVVSRSVIPLNYYDARFKWLNSAGLTEFEASWGAERCALDIGCSSGLMLFEMERRGWKCGGLDISSDITAYLQKKGYDTYTGTIDDVSIPLGKYQFVSLLHVIEHVPSPEHLLRFSRACMSEGGWLFVVTPCCMTPPAAFAGREWFDDCTHIHFFTRQSLMTLIERSGFDVLHVHTPCGVRFETHNLRWIREMIGPAVDRTLSDTGMGDLIWVIARAKQM